MATGFGSVSLKVKLHPCDNRRRSVLIIPTKRLAVLAFGFAVAVSASPSFAQTRQDRNSRAYEKAIHECMVKAGKALNTTFGNYNSFAYWACMGEHGYQH